MGVKADQDRVKTLLRDTIKLLCKNGLAFKDKFSIDAVIGVTIDEEDVFLISMNEIVKTDRPASESSGDENVTPFQIQHNNHKSPCKRIYVKTEVGVEPEVQMETAGTGDMVASSDEDDLSHGEYPTAHESNSDFADMPSNKRQRDDADEDQNFDEDGSNGPGRKIMMQIKEEVDDSVWTGNNDSDQSQLQHNLPDFTVGANYGSPDLSGVNFMPGNSQEHWLQQSELMSTIHNASVARLPTTSAVGRLPTTSTVTSDANLTQRIEGQSTGINLDSSQQMTPPPTTAPFICRVCDKSFDRRYSWIRHENWHEGRFERYCPQCHKGFSSTSTLKGHIANVHTGVKEHKCPLCEKEYAYKHHLKDHIKRNHVELTLTK